MDPSHSGITPRWLDPTKYLGREGPSITTLSSPPSTKKALKQTNYPKGVIESTSSRFDLYQRRVQSTTDNTTSTTNTTQKTEGGEGGTTTRKKPSPFPINKP